MRKIIKRKIHISTHKRDLIDFINDEFYSHDKHNAFIEFTMKSLPTDNIIALFYFQKTKRYIETKAFVDGDKFTIEFDTSLITADETVLGFIYFEKVAQSADVHRFSFGVKVSEIDKLHDVPIQEQTTKRVVAIEDIVTKTELDELFKRIEKNGGTYNDTEIRSSISSIEERVHTLESKPDKDTVYDDSDVKNRLSTLESNSTRYLTEHQSLSEYALKSELYNDSALSERVTRLEQKPAVDTSGLATKEELQEVRNAQPQIDKSDLVTKEELESKGYLTAHQNLDEYAKKSEIPERYNDTSLVERVTSLESKAIANGSYDDKPLLEKIHAIEERFNNSSNLYLTAHQSLDHLVTKQELDSKGYLTNHQDISGLVTKEELASKNYLTEHQSLASLVTKDELEQKGYLTNHQDLSEYAKKTELYNDTALKERVFALENKAPVDLSHLVTKDELDSKHYLTEHQPLTDYALKSEIPQAYNDSELKSRLTALEAKEDKDTVYNDTEIKSRLEAIESKNYLTEHQSLENYALKTEIPQAYNDADLKERVTSLEAKALANGAYDDSNLRTRIHALEIKEDKDTVYDDADVKRRLSALEAKPDVQVDSLITKQELESKGYLTNHQDLSEYAKKTELPTPYNDTALSERVAKLETKEDKDTVYNDAELRGRVLALESRTDNDTIYNDSELRGRVSALENKTDKDTIYNDEEVKRRLSVLENKTDNFVSGVSVSKQDKTVTLTYSYVDGSAKNVSFEDSDTLAVAYDDAEIKQRLTNLEGRPQIDVTTLVSKEELASKNYLTNHQDVSGFVTKNELEEKHYLTQHQSLAEYALKSELYNDADIKQRLTALENNYVTKEQLHEATELDETQFVSPEELEAKHYLTAQQAESVYAKKSELYNDSALASRVSTLESKQDNDTVYNDTEIKQRLTNLENRPQVESYNDSEIKQRLSVLETNHVTKQELNASIDRYDSQIITINELEAKNYLTTPQADSVYAKKSEIPNTSNFATTDSVNNLLRTQGEQATKISALESKSAYEIHGTGMPNGQVSAPIGTTYVDMSVTNGALKWIKQSGTGNTGWKVLIGDTGWRTLNSVSRAGNSFIKIRRVNNLVTYQFGGLQWGWFGVGRRNGPGYMGHGSSGSRGAKVLPVGGIPEGFRSESSLVGPTFNDGGRPYGVWYLGGKSDSNYIQFTFNNEIPTDRDIGDIRVSAVSYLTDEDWPTTLP